MVTWTALFSNSVSVLPCMWQTNIHNRKKSLGKIMVSLYLIFCLFRETMGRKKTMCIKFDVIIVSSSMQFWIFSCFLKYVIINIYAVQQDTQSVSMSEFYSALMLARHVSVLISPSAGAFCTSCMCRFANTSCTKGSCWWTDEVRNMSS